MTYYRRSTSTSQIFGLIYLFMVPVWALCACFNFVSCLSCNMSTFVELQKCFWNQGKKLIGAALFGTHYIYKHMSNFGAHLLIHGCCLSFMCMFQPQIISSCNMPTFVEFQNFFEIQRKSWKSSMTQNRQDLTSIFSSSFPTCLQMRKSPIFSTFFAFKARSYKNFIAVNFMLP